MVQKLNGMLARLIAERSEMPVMMPGSAIGRMISSVIASRPKKRAAIERGRGERAEQDGDRSRDQRDADRKPERVPDVLPLEGDGEPLQRQTGRRELVALVLGREGVEQDEGHRHVQEEEPGRGGELQAERSASPLRAHRTPPAVWRC